MRHYNHSSIEHADFEDLFAFAEAWSCLGEGVVAQVESVLGERDAAFADASAIREAFGLLRGWNRDVDGALESWLHAHGEVS